LFWKQPETCSFKWSSEDIASYLHYKPPHRAENVFSGMRPGHCPSKIPGKQVVDRHSRSRPVGVNTGMLASPVLTPVVPTEEVEVGLEVIPNWGLGGHASPYPAWRAVGTTGVSTGLASISPNGAGWACRPCPIWRAAHR
jgi:hypothetical protein